MINYIHQFKKYTRDKQIEKSIHDISIQTIVHVGIRGYN